MTSRDAPLDVEQARRHFPGTLNWIYFNTAAQALLPGPVAQRIHELNTTLIAGGITTYPDTMEAIERTRAAVARLIGSTPDTVAFTDNTAGGIARIAESFPWQPGDQVLLADVEFPANVYPWAAQQRHGVELQFVPVDDGRLPVEAYLQRIGPRTRLIAVSLVQFAGGYRIDLEPLARACREKGIFLFLDAIQGLGAIPFDIRNTPVGALACEARKWLCGPLGCGFLHVDPEWAPRLQGSTVGPRSMKDPDDMLQYRTFAGGTHGPASPQSPDPSAAASPTPPPAAALDYAPHVSPDARRFEAGYPNVAGIAGLGAALELAETLGTDAIHRHIAALVQRFVTRLEAEQFVIHGPQRAEERAGIVAFDYPGDPWALFHDLHKEGISLSVRDGRLRVSPHFYNTEVEVDGVVERIAEAAGEASG